VTAFLEIESLDDVPQWAHAARKSTDYGTVPPGELAWVARARQLARGVQVERKFDPSKRKELLAAIRALAANPQDARRLPRLLAEYGIRLVVVEKLNKTRIDGACFWLDPTSPVIALYASVRPCGLLLVHAPFTSWPTFSKDRTRTRAWNPIWLASIANGRKTNQNVNATQMTSPRPRS